MNPENGITRVRATAIRGAARVQTYWMRGSDVAVAGVEMRREEVLTFVVVVTEQRRDRGGGFVD